VLGGVGSAVRSGAISERAAACWRRVLAERAEAEGVSLTCLVGATPPPRAITAISAAPSVPQPTPGSMSPRRNAPTDIGATGEPWRRRGHSTHVVELVIGIRELHLDCYLLRVIPPGLKYLSNER
jgi:hypothetical protein